VYKILQQLNRPKKKALQSQFFFGFDDVEKRSSNYKYQNNATSSVLIM
jgi:hypothetical protein